MTFSAQLDRGDTQLEVRVCACIETHDGAPEITIESVKLADGTDAPELSADEMVELRILAYERVAR